MRSSAHGGEVSSLVLVPTIASRVNIPIIAAGGFATGKGLAAALVLGADGISVGTRFVLTKESPLHPNMKTLCLNAVETETIYSNKFDGMYSRVLKTKNAEIVAGKIGVNPFKVLSSAKVIKQMLNIPYTISLC